MYSRGCQRIQSRGALSDERPAPEPEGADRTCHGVLVRREDLPMRRALAAALLAASILLSPLTAQLTHAATLPTQHATFIARVIELVNVERQRVGAPPLVAN